MSKNPPQPLPGNPDPKNGAIAAPEGGVNLYDHVEHHSHVEPALVAQVETNRDHIKLFTKRPRRFRVRASVGECSPGSAIVYDENGTRWLYLVCETKVTCNLDNTDWDEALRIRFAEHHFEAAPVGPVDYIYTTDKAGLLIGEAQEDLR
ncbi:restriction endonuclease [Sanguibacter sp. A247]|uniref:restriction endonuclease n=1 Tax=unclassified Sanguibacter TaxID=2645534 RepID=UPI003FD7B6FF